MRCRLRELRACRGWRARVAIAYAGAGATIHIIGTDDEIFLVGMRRGALDAADFVF